MPLNVRFDDKGDVFEITKPHYTCGKCGAKGPCGQVQQTSTGGLLIEFPPPEGWIVFAIQAPEGCAPRDEPMTACPACWPAIYRKMSAAFSSLITLTPRAAREIEGN